MSILTPEELENELRAIAFAGGKAKLDVHPGAIRRTVDALAAALREAMLEYGSPPYDDLPLEHVPLVAAWLQPPLQEEADDR